jgi:hypothetical protein
MSHPLNNAGQITSFVPLQCPVFIGGVMNRCGTNFLLDAIRCHDDFQIPDLMPESYLLEHAHLLDQYVRHTSARWSNTQREADPGCLDELVRELGNAVLRFCERRIRSHRRLAFKTPRIFNLDLLKPLFGEHRLILLVRDGRDVVESAQRSFSQGSSRLPMRLWMQRWSEGAQRILDYMSDNPPQAMLVRYEQLLDEFEPTMKAILRHIGADESRYDWQRADRMPVRGSSQTSKTKGGIHWNPVDRPRDFRPVGRWQSWNLRQRWMFDRIAGRQLIKLGYEASQRWVLRPIRAKKAA